MNKQLESQLKKAKKASIGLLELSTKQKNAILRDLAEDLVQHSKSILNANLKDFQAVPKNYKLGDRLGLTEGRIKDMATGLRAVTRLADPIGTVLEKQKQPSGITVSRVQVPLGVIGVIYEARPNVTVEIFSLAIKTGNAVILKGGRDAFHSNTALVKRIRAVLKRHEVDPNAVQMLDPFKRSLTEQLLKADGLVDIVIPRGSERLIQFVRSTATVPVIETGAGVCHTYVERTANIAQAIDIVVNAKVRRCTVCNTLDTVVVDEAISKRFLKAVSKELSRNKVVVYADAPSFTILRKSYPEELLRKAKPQHFGKEFLAMKLAIKTVKNFEAGMRFIQDHTSGHSEAIVTTNIKRANEFTSKIDAAAVYVNTSTAFTDGFEFGLGAEVGISTQKLHARGPMGLRELTTYKWVVTSKGKTRTS